MLLLVFCTGTESRWNMRSLFFLSPILTPTLSPSSPIWRQTQRQQNTQLDVAASQNLITHVKSPLPITSCVTPVDHIMFLFLYSFGHGQSITQHKPPLFSFSWSFYVHIYAQMLFPEQKCMLHCLNLWNRFNIFWAEVCFRWSCTASYQTEVTLNQMLSIRWLLIL